MMQVPSSPHEARQPATTKSRAGPTQVSSIRIIQSFDFTLPFDPQAISKEEIELADEDVIEGRS